MGTLAASTLVTRANDVLNQSTGMVQWLEPELLRYLSDAQRQAVILHPEVNPDTRTVTLAQGSRQTLPADAWSLLDVVRNQGVGGGMDGTGPAIEMVDRRVIDRSMPDWHSVTAAAVVKYVVYDLKRSRRTFYVNPPQPAGVADIEIVVSQIPGEITNSATAIELDDNYEPALLAYMLYMAKSKDLAAEGQGMEMAAGYYKQFMLALGMPSEN